MYPIKVGPLQNYVEDSFNVNVWIMKTNKIKGRFCRTYKMADLLENKLYNLTILGV